MEKYKVYYEAIVNEFKKRGHTVKFDHIMEVTLGAIYKAKDKDRVDYYKKVVKWINSCDVVVAEVSFPSTINIGHEITLALEKEKPVLALFTSGSEPVFLRGNILDKFFLRKYTKETIGKVVEEFLDALKTVADVRFNFFISPEIGNYLDFVSKNRRIPRAVFLRSLVEQEIKKDREYKKESTL